MTPIIKLNIHMVETVWLSACFYISDVAPYFRFSLVLTKSTQFLPCYTGVSPDIKVHGANMEPIWGRQDPGGPHVGLMNFAIWAYIFGTMCDRHCHVNSKIRYKHG